MQVKKGKLFVVTAPSGAGKTTLVQHVVARLSGHYSLSQVVTYTTKQPRPGERQGIEYHFLSEDEFVQRIGEGFFVEHSTAYGSYYGFPKEIFADLNEGKSYMGIVDIAGATAIKAYADEAILVGIRPPDQQALMQRLTQRAEDSSSSIAFRLGLADDELNHITENFFDYIIVNDVLEVAVDCLAEIVKSEIT